MRLDKFLADRSAFSRKEIKKIISCNRVMVNGEIVNQPELHVTDTDVVFLDQKKISGQEYYYYMLHKPAGVVSACKDEQFQTVIDFFKDCPRYKDLFPVGRLDKDTEGLIIITNDGAYSHQLTSPNKHVDKTYYFETDARLNKDACEIMKQGMVLKDGFECKSAVLQMENENQGYLTISEGAYHQVKRMVAACGGHVTYLKRISIGALSLDKNLERGCYRELTEDEKCQATCQFVEKI